MLNTIRWGAAGAALSAMALGGLVAGSMGPADRSVTRGPAGSSTIFSVPPTAMDEPFSQDVDACRRMLDATNQPFPQSVMASMSMPDFDRPAN